ncbi:MAG: 1-(5-phosphoribosyl)-5-[(5-phosphoribosylamino)methylideneamino]imidazole-4-carboxamide isomerase [Puniceicoccales bacterium]|jgi:phosphoribosylformimino-5-aminoimidazole carboxamide ribotide isomerase|nr:1-(5-phosphoribosyl)-5-[(5-phosphoribosylamino)methylideneamino]imidazole-4-carboxamide isomerase [Puniceicoccales bacterium]
MIIYPAVDIKDGKCVRLKQGLAHETTTYFSDPAEPARLFAAEGSPWIHVVDLDGAFNGTPRNLDALGRIAATGLKVQFGGGLRDAASVEAAIAAGASRVILGTKAAADEGFVAEMVKAHGSKIAVGIDAKDGLVAVKGWVEVTGHKAVDFAVRMAAVGVRTIIYTDIATDGMLSGPNFVALEQMLLGTTANIIASGGVSRREDIIRLKAMTKTHANLDGAIVGKALYEKRVELPDLLAIAGGA